MAVTKLIKGLQNFLKLSGGTMTGTLDMDDNDLSNVKRLSFEDGDFAVQEVKDEDDMATNSATMLASQQSIKAYVDNSINLKISTVTLDASDTLALDSVAQIIVPAQGSDQIILPLYFTLIVDRAINDNTNSCDLFISWGGTTTLGKELGYYRNWFKNVSTDKVYNLDAQGYKADAYITADPSNQPIKVQLSAAVSTDSITSLKCITSYHVYDNS